MKYSIVALTALATAVVAEPQFLNSAFDVEEGKPFEIKYSGCDDGCTIILQNGDSKNLKDVETLTSDATGSSFTFTPSDLPTDTYNFKIVDKNGDSNYSAQFEYTGTGSLPTSTATGTATATTPVTETETATATKSATVSVSGSSSVSVTTAVSTSTITSASVETETSTSTLIHSTNGTTVSTVKKPTASATETESETSKTGKPTASASVTSVPDSGAARLTSSLALVAGAIMAMVYLN